VQDIPGEEVARLQGCSQHVQRGPRLVRQQPRMFAATSSRRKPSVSATFSPPKGGATTLLSGIKFLQSAAAPPRLADWSYGHQVGHVAGRLCDLRTSLCISSHLNLPMDCVASSHKLSNALLLNPAAL
jgi:hypothetical protein